MFGQYYIGVASAGPQRAPKLSHKKSRYGCQRCRQRRVKVSQDTGEIAVRILQAARELPEPVETFALYTADDDAHCRLGRPKHAIRLPSPAAYLDVAGLVGLAREHAIDAVHPGYGFLSESAELARRMWAEAGARRPMSAALEGFHYARCLVEQEGRNMLAGRRPDPKRQSALPPPHHLPGVIDEEPCIIGRDSCDWTAMQAFLDGRTADFDGDDILPAWEQYADLGGLTEIR
ncbi:hypothetical protein CDD83_908 [Cordyceps sp. RAO-2017]|nr:hypothetical protein CDD83_908 [Cordyceps sp. RAO-2017]